MCRYRDVIITSCYNYYFPAFDSMTIGDSRMLAAALGGGITGGALLLLILILLTVVCFYKMLSCCDFQQEKLKSNEELQRAHHQTFDFDENEAYCRTVHYVQTEDNEAYVDVNLRDHVYQLK